ncbi:MAG: response regulator transcription factor [Steroidobacteraceae bacterium]
MLVVEDEQDLAMLLERHLKDAGYQVRLAHAGDVGLQIARSRPFDLIILDVMLPVMDGLEVCRCLRGERVYTPILMLTAKSTEIDRVLGLELGADDYLTKPFSVPELLARVRALFRRIQVLAEAGKSPVQRISLGEEFSIDMDSREVKVRGEPVELTHREFDLLLHFAQNPGRVYTRAQLLDSIWGEGHEGYEHAINCHINRLRAKIERDQANPQLLLTVWGVGYKFAGESSLTRA